MKVLSLEISNILSIESANIKFGDFGLVLVEGWNHDDNRANGAGKTAIFNALSFALFNDMPRKITTSEILRDGCKTGYAYAKLDVDGDIYEITRTRPKGVKFKVNGEDKDLTQSEFESQIKLSYNQFLITAYNAQSSSDRFLGLNDSAKKDFLVKLMNLDDINRCKKVIDANIKNIDVIVKKHESDIQQNNAKLEVYQESKIDIDVLYAQLDGLEVDCNNLVAEISTLRSIAKPDTSKFDNDENTLNEKLGIVNQARAKRSVLFDEYKRWSLKDKPFKETDECESCGTQFSREEMRPHYDKHILSVRAELNSLNAKIATLDTILAKESEIKAALQRIKQDRYQQTADYSTSMERAAQLSAILSNKKNKIDNLSIAIDKALDNKSKIDKLKLSIDASVNELDKQKNLLAIQQSLQALYSPTGVSAYILDSAVATFNDCVASYVSMIWPNASYILKSYKENSAGDIVAKFSEELIINGKEKSVGSLSGGEHRALSLAIDFAVMDVVSKNFNTSINPIIMDEPFDALDIIGKETVMDLLEKLAVDREIWVIDHSTEIKSMFSKVIRIEKKNGISNVVI